MEQLQRQPMQGPMGMLPNGYSQHATAPVYGPGGFNFSEMISRAIKYIVEGGAVAIAAYFIPRRRMNIQEIIMIALTAAAVFAILDLWAPAVGIASRQGAGFGIGASMVGFPGMGPGLPGVPAPMV